MHHIGGSRAGRHDREIPRVIKEAAMLYGRETPGTECSRAVAAFQNFSITAGDAALVIVAARDEVAR